MSRARAQKKLTLGRHISTSINDVHQKKFKHREIHGNPIDCSWFTAHHTTSSSPFNVWLANCNAKPLDVTAACKGHEVRRSVHLLWLCLETFWDNTTKYRSTYHPHTITGKVVEAIWPQSILIGVWRGIKTHLHHYWLCQSREKDEKAQCRAARTTCLSSRSSADTCSRLIPGQVLRMQTRFKVKRITIKWIMLTLDKKCWKWDCLKMRYPPYFQ